MKYLVKFIVKTFRAIIKNMKLKIPFYKQDTDHACGPVSLQMVLSFLGDFKSEKSLVKEAHTNHDVGTKHEAMIETARKAIINIKNGL